MQTHTAHTNISTCRHARPRNHMQENTHMHTQAMIHLCPHRGTQTAQITNKSTLIRWVYTVCASEHHTNNCDIKKTNSASSSSSSVQLSCWQRTIICVLPRPAVCHSACQHVCVCPNAHSVPQLITGNTTHGPSYSRLSLTSAHTQSDCLTKVSG